MKTGMIAKFVCTVTLFWSPAVCPASAENDDVDGPIVTPENAAKEMIAALEEIVSTRESQLASLKLLVESGRADSIVLADSTVELWRARNGLAEARQQPKALIEGLRQILIARQQAFLHLRQMNEAGRTGDSELEAAKLRMLQSRVDLCQATLQLAENP